MPIFTATIASVSATTVAQDVFELVGSSQDRTRLRGVRLGQNSIALSSQASILGVQIIRGYDVASSGGTAVTPRNIHSWSSRAANGTVTRLSTTVASSSTATPHVLEANDWHVIQQPYEYAPCEESMPWLKMSERLVVRITAPSTTLAISATIEFEECPQVPA